MQFLEEVVDAPVVVKRLVLGMVQTVQKRLEVPQMRFWRGCGRPCAHAATSASHRHGWDDLRRVFLSHFTAFFALCPNGRECSRALGVALTRGVVLPDPSERSAQNNSNSSNSSNSNSNSSSNSSSGNNSSFRSSWSAPRLESSCLLCCILIQTRVA